jgi:hypothetical protein
VLAYAEMATRTTRRELEIADHLWECLTRIAEDNGTDPQVVLNQAIYDLARRFNFLTPGASNGASPRQSAAGASAIAEPPVERRSMVSAGPGSKAPVLFVVNSAGEMTKIEKDQFIIGRSRTCDLVIASSKVSRRHCSVLRENGDFFIEDLGSPNGVWRDGVKIEKEKIQDGDEFLISDETIRFVMKAGGGAAAGSARR